MDVLACFGSREHLPPQKRWLVLHRPHRCSTGQIHAVLTKTQSPGDSDSRPAVFLRSPGLQGSSWCCGDVWQGREETHQGSWSWNGCPHIQYLAQGGSLAVVRLCSAPGTQLEVTELQPQGCSGTIPPSPSVQVVLLRANFSEGTGRKKQSRAQKL